MFTEKRITILTSLIAICSSLFAGAMWVDDRYAKTEDITKIAIQGRLNEIEITKIRIMSIIHANEDTKQAVINDVIKQLESSSKILRDKLDSVD